MYPKSLNELIECFRYLPGVGERTAERFALKVADMNEEDVTRFAKSLVYLKEHLHHCSVCGNLTDDDICEICADTGRDHSQILVVESSRDVNAMEKTREFFGIYHVLNGLISSSKGVMPEDLDLELLLKQAKDAKEIILATSTTIDGETTAMYLGRLLKETYPNLLITRIAHGLPSGGLLDYADEMTLSHALSDRREMR
jgi:recombination protein RecR